MGYSNVNEMDKTRTTRRPPNIVAFGANADIQRNFVRKVASITIESIKRMWGWKFCV
jgi:hypothetical protein